MGAESLRNLGVGAKIRITTPRRFGGQAQLSSWRGGAWAPASLRSQSEQLSETVSQFTPYVHHMVGSFLR